MNSKEQNAAQRLAELGLSLDDQIKWNHDSIFPKLQGFGAKGGIKAKHKLLVQVQSELAETLYPDEEVLYVAKGVQVRFLEQYFMGIWANLINQTVFVLTNVRLLMFNSNTKGKPKHSIWMVYFSEVVKFNKRFLGGMTMKLKDGSKFVFTGFKGADRKNMPQIFERINQSYSELGFTPTVTQSRENLCTVCKQVVARNVYDCNHCGQKYWTPKELGLRSLIFPSWGDWLMGHYLLSCLELFGYVMSWIVILAMLFSPKVELIAVLPFAALILFVEHGIDAGMTWSIAKKGLVPRKPMTVKPQKPAKK